MAKINIREMRFYVDERGRQVKEFTPVPRDKTQAFYRGVGQMVVNQPGKPPHPVSFEFGFPEKITLEQVFERFDDEAKLAVENFKKEQEKKIVTARSMPNLVGPDGKKLV